MNRTLVAALLTLGDPNRLTGGYLYHRRMAELAPQQNARLEFVSIPDRLFPLAALDVPAAIRQAHRLGAQVLILDSIAAPFFGAWPVPPLGGMPLVAILHQPPGGVDHGPLRTHIQAPLDRLAYRTARVLLIASDSLAGELVVRGMPRARMRVVPPGRDVSATIGPPAGDLRRGRLCAFLCVANWVQNKGIDSLLEAFARLPPTTGTLHLAGNTEAEPAYGARIRNRIAQPDLADRVVVHGPLSREDVAALYEAADVFVLPSLRETYGTVHGEAMAFGLPVVGWRSGNLPHLAENGREGLMLEPGDIAGLAAALERLANDEPLRRAMGEAARRRAEKRPTWEESAALFFGAIREALAGIIDSVPQQE
jgi:glycosyltransferase involved in cell wall biosynthesis